MFNSLIRSKKVVLLCIALLLIVSVEDAFCAGVTIIVHGFQSGEGTPPWVLYMRNHMEDRIESENPGLNAYGGKITVQDDDGFGGNPAYAEITPWENETNADEYIFYVDWSDVSHLSLDNSEKKNWEQQTPQGIGDALYTWVIADLVHDELLKSEGGNTLVEMPIHLIGHSRGASVVSELARLLALKGIWVDQITTLDPQRIPLSDDAPIEIYENVLFADNYWSNGNQEFCPEGYDLTGAYNRQLTPPLAGGYTEDCHQHADLHLWYHGTINTSFGTVFDGEAYLGDRSTWYSLASDTFGVTAGFYYSRLMGGNRLATIPPTRNGYHNDSKLGGAGAREPAPNPTEDTWPNILRADMTTPTTLTRGQDSVSISWISTFADEAPVYVEFELDNDRNPFNGMIQQIGQWSWLYTQGESTPWLLWELSRTAPVPADAPLGNFWLALRIRESAGEQRYFYMSEQLTIQNPAATATPTPTATPGPTATPTPSPTATPAGSQCGIYNGARVLVINSAEFGGTNVRSCAGIECPDIGDVNDGDTGTVIGGPTAIDGFVWWNVDWDEGLPTGWGIEQSGAGAGGQCRLQVITATPTPTPTPTAQPSPTSTPSVGDLALVSIELSEVTPPYHPGDQPLTRYYVHNLAAQTSPNFSVIFYASTDQTITASDYAVGQEPAIQGVGSGLTQVYTTRITVPTGLPFGSYYFGAIINPADSNPINNAAFFPTLIEVQPNLTPTPTPTPSPSPSPTATVTPTQTAVASPTPSPTPGNSPTPTPSPTVPPGQCLPLTLLHSLANPSASAGDNFGTAVAFSGNKVLVGATQDDTGASNAGIAYLFDATTGEILHTFENPTPMEGDKFGVSVAISGNYVLIGSQLDTLGTLNSGRVHLFDVSSYALLHVFDNPTGHTGAFFGCSVAIENNNLLVGASGDDSDQGGGIARLYDGATYQLLQTFHNPSEISGGEFGHSVAISGNTVVVGDPSNNTGGNDTGIAYLFNATTGSLLYTLLKPSPAPMDSFGYSVAISGNSVLVGAYLDDTGGDDAGSTYLFDASSGLAVRTFNNPAPAPDTSSWFGYSVAITENMALIGAPRNDTANIDVGKAYLFDPVTGGLLQTFDKPTPANSDRFGNSVALLGNSILVGAYLSDAGALDAGSAYLFGCPQPTPFDDGAIQTENIPGELAALQDYPAQITVLNTGNTTWSAADGYGLAVLTDTCAMVGTTRVPISGGATIAPGQSYTFAVLLNVPSTIGICPLEFQMVRDAESGPVRMDAQANFFGSSITLNPSIVAAVNNAAFESSTIPLTMKPGQGLWLGVGVLNTGTTFWFEGSDHSLGAVSDPNNILGGVTRFPVPYGQIIQPNKISQFLVYFKAPMEPGDYSVQLRMVKEFVEWFGENINLNIHVEIPPNQVRGWESYE